MKAVQAITLNIQALELLNLDHFQQLRALCNEKQKKKFDGLLDQLAGLMATPSNADGHRPPPREREIHHPPQERDIHHHPEKDIHPMEENTLCPPPINNKFYLNYKHEYEKQFCCFIGTHHSLFRLQESSHFNPFNPLNPLNPFNGPRCLQENLWRHQHHIRWNFSNHQKHWYTRP
jgi:hypothetical protein